MTPDDSTASQSAFEALLAPILGQAYGLAMNLTGNPADAEDLVQDAALLAFRGFDGFEEGTNFKAWFYRILTNRHFSNRRRLKRRPSEVELEEAPQQYMWDRTQELGLHSRNEDPAATFLSRVDVDHVRSAIAALPDDFGVVASLYFLEELSYQEIAEMVGIPVGTVRSRLHRGRRMLQKALWTIAVEEGIVSELKKEHSAV